jgi:isopentenyldiphosphate isomerase
MEMVDVLQPDGDSAGQILSRDEVHAQGLWHRTVHVWVRNAAGQLLLQQRADLKETNPGLWDVSVAGHVSAGQTSLEAALRELEEEIGLCVLEDELQYLFTVQSEQSDQEGHYIDREFQDVYLLQKEVQLGSLFADPNEVKALAWIESAVLRKLAESRNPELVTHDQEFDLLWPILAEI